MKKILVFALGVLVLHSCQIEESYTFDEKGNGEYDFTFSMDLSSMKGMYNDEEYEEEPGDEWEDEEIEEEVVLLKDSVFDSNEMLERIKAKYKYKGEKFSSTDETFFKETFAGLTFSEKEWSDGSIELGANQKFKDLQVKSPFDMLFVISEYTDDDTSADYEEDMNVMKGIASNFTLDTDHFVHGFVLSKEQKESFSSIKNADGEEKEFMKLMEFFRINTTYHFPYEVKKVNKKKITEISEDKKSITVSQGILDWIMGFEEDLQVNFKKN